MLNIVKSRIEAIPSDALASGTAASGDPIRGWWSCVATAGPLHVETTACGTTFEAGVAHADGLVDGGVGAVIMAPRVPVIDRTRAITGLLCHADAVAITPRSHSDIAWMQHCVTVRDLQAEEREHIADCLDRVDGETAGFVGVLLGLAARKTPVVLLGAAAHAAAVVAQRQSVSAASWWRSGCTGTDPILDIACQRLQFEPWWTARTDVLPEVLEELVAGTISSMRD